MHVRRALRVYLDAQVDDDPLLELVGLAGDAHTPTDVARNHDRYLYGAPETRSSSATG